MVSARAAKEARRRAALKKSTPSTIDRLEPEVRELIAQLRVDKGFTIDEIRASLVKMIGEDRAPSRSALGRHVRGLAEISADMRETRIYAEALAKEAGGKEGHQLLDMNTQLLQANMFRLMLAEKDGEGIQLTPKEAKEFSEALRNIALTRKTDLEVIAKAEERARREERAAAVAKFEAAERGGEIDKKALERAKRIMGFE